VVQGGPSVVPKLSSLVPAAAEDVAGREGRRTRTRLMMGALRSKLLTNAKYLEPAGFEATANSMIPHMQGVIMALRSVDPELIKEVQADMSQRMCDGEPTDMEIMLFAKSVVVDPAIATAGSLECALSRRAREDIVMWTLLDAWRTAGAPPIPSTAALRRSATDERTRQFLTMRPESYLSQTNQSSRVAAPVSAGDRAAMVGKERSE
jgi:hypothetical protein